LRAAEQIVDGIDGAVLVLMLIMGRALGRCRDGGLLAAIEVDACAVPTMSLR
jgi:hypothetical protein